MNKSKSNFFTILLALILAGNLHAAGYSEENADEVYKKITHVYVLKPDGTTEFTYSHELKVLTSYALNRKSGESFIVYNPDYQELEIQRSATKMTTGEIVHSPENAFNEVLPRCASDNVPEMNLREMVVTHTGLEFGCTVEFAYTLTSEKDFLPGLQGKVVLGKRSPVREFNVIVKVPNGQYFEHHLANSSQSPVKTNEEGFHVYTWQFKNVPLVAQETQQPDFEKFVPALYFSSAKKNEIIDHIKSKSEDIFALNDKAVESVKELTTDELTAMDKIIKIYDHIHNNVGTGNCDPLKTGCTPMPAQEAFDRNVGNHLDRAILFAAMLKALDIGAYPAIFSQDASMPDDKLFLGELENPIVIASPSEKGGKKVYLDPNKHQSSFTPEYLYGKKFFAPWEPEIRKQTDKIKAQKGIFELSCNLEIDSTGKFSGNGIVKIGGHYQAGLKRSENEKLVKSTFSKHSYDAELQNPDFIAGDFAPFAAKFKINDQNPPQNTGNLKEVSIPFNPGDFNTLDFPAIKSDRKTPVKLHRNVNESYHFKIKIPENSSIVHNIGNIDFSNEAGKVNISVIEDVQYFTIKGSLSISGDFIKPPNYKEFVELLEKWYNPKNFKLYIK